jgi:hypothetical protein
MSKRNSESSDPAKQRPDLQVQQHSEKGKQQYSSTRGNDEDDFCSEASDPERSFRAIRFMLFNTINYKLEFSDEKLSEQYYIFRTASISPAFSFGVAVFLSVSCIIYWSFVFHAVFSPFVLIVALISLIFGVLLWILVYLRFMIPLADQQFKRKPLLVRLSSWVSVGVSITLGLILVMRSLRRCPSMRFEDHWSCNPTYGTGTIPSDIALVLMFSPLVFSVVFPFLPFSVVYLCQFIATGFVGSTLIYLQAAGSTVHVSLLIVISLFMLFVYRLQQMEFFLYTTKYYQALKEQARQDKRIAARLSNEMKCLISSVCHDLKSVNFLNVVLISFDYFVNIASLCVHSRV